MARKTSASKFVREKVIDHEAAELELASDKFTDRQRLFCLAYLRHSVGARAIIEAGYRCAMENAASMASRLLKVPHIAAFIEARRKEMAAALKLDADKVLGELMCLGTANMAQVMEHDPAGINPPKLDLALADEKFMRAISSIKTTTRYEKNPDPDGPPIEVREFEIKLHEKSRPLELLGKNLKLYTDKVEVNATVDIATRVQAARDKARQRLIEAEAKTKGR